MKAKPLHRSLTFWSGILVVAFISWAWRDSIGSFTFLRSGHAYLTQAGSGVAVCYDGTLSTGFQMHRDYRQYKAVLNGGEIGITFLADVTGHREPIILPLPMAVQQSYKLSVFLPHWLILLTVVLPWYGLLLWRARRIRGASEAPL
jgi:hypothetical protein